MRILAIDLGKNKSVFVDYTTGQGRRQFGKVGTNLHDLQKLLERCRPDQLVIEACPAAGWVCDLAALLKVPVQVANGNDERWRWKTVKEKSDRKDALKLAQLTEMDSLPTVHVPKPTVRQWRSLIEYRHGLVDRRTAVKNSIRSIYERQGLRLPSAKSAWTKAAVEELKKQVSEAKPGDLWLFQVECELKQLESVGQQIEQVEAKLEELSKENESVRLLKTAPCVGPRLSEAVVAILDDPHRFENGRQVACYAGLTPRRWQSGESDRQGRISKAGNPLLRALLVEIAWLGVRNKTWMLEAYERVGRGSAKRKKIAIVAVARRLLVKLWAMLRDGTEWKEPAKVSASNGKYSSSLAQDLLLGTPSAGESKGDGPSKRARPVSRLVVHGGAPVASPVPARRDILGVDTKSVTRSKKGVKAMAHAR